MRYLDFLFSFLVDFVEEDLGAADHVLDLGLQLIASLIRDPREPVQELLDADLVHGAKLSLRSKLATTLVTVQETRLKRIL